jgi:hypothetical protein
MDSAIGGLAEPFQKIPVCLLNAGKTVTAPEAYADKVNLWRSTLPLTEGTVRGTWHRLEPVMADKMRKLDIKFGFAVMSADNHMLHVIVQNFKRSSAQVMKGSDMGIHECLQRTAFYQFGIHGPGISPHQKEQVHGAGAVDLGHLKVDPVHLALKSWNSFKTDKRFSPLAVFDFSHIMPDCIVTAGVA